MIHLSTKQKQSAKAFSTQDIDLDWLSLENDIRKATAKEWRTRGEYEARKSALVQIAALIDRADMDRREKWLMGFKVEAAKDSLPELRRIIVALTPERPDTTRPAVIAWLEKNKERH